MRSATTQRFQLFTQWRGSVAPEGIRHRETLLDAAVNLGLVIVLGGQRRVDRGQGETYDAMLLRQVQAHGTAIAFQVQNYLRQPVGTALAVVRICQHATEVTDGEEGSTKRRSTSSNERTPSCALRFPVNRR